MTVSVPYVVANILILDKFGFPQQRSFDFLNLDPNASNSPLNRIDANQFNDLLNIAAQYLNDPLIALKTGDGFRISNFKETGKVYSVCENLIEVFELNARYQRVAIDIGTLSTVIIKGENTDRNRYFYDYELYVSDVNKVRHIFYLVLGAYVTAFRWLTWSNNGKLLGVYTQLPEPQDIQNYRDFFGCPVFFNQTHNRIEFDETGLFDKLSTRDPVRKAQYIAKLDMLISSQHAQESFMTSLKATIAQNIKLGRYSLPCVAETLKMSETSLKTQIKASNVKYRDLVDDVRKDLFIDKYNPSMSFTQMAHYLGYSDQPAFSKAFKRWYGMSPSQYKTRHAETLSPQENKAL